MLEGVEKMPVPIILLRMRNTAPVMPSLRESSYSYLFSSLTSPTSTSSWAVLVRTWSFTSLVAASSLEELSKAPILVDGLCTRTWGELEGQLGVAAVADLI